MRVGVAVVAGFANEILHIDQVRFGEFALFVGVALGVVFYLVTILVVLRVFHYSEAELKGKNRYLTLGGGSYIVLWVTVAVLLYTLGLSS